MIKLAMAMFLLAGAPAAMAAGLTDAHDAYDRNEVAKAERLYAAIAADAAASADDRAEAGVELARIAWLIDGKADVALQRLAAARTTGGKACDVSEMTARVLREAKRGAEAIAAEPALLAACPEPRKRDPIRVHAIAARLDRAIDVPAERPSLLRQASAEAAQLTQDAGNDGAKARLAVAVLAGDAAAALAAWKDYYWLTDADAPPALAQFHPTALFEKGLSAGASDGDRVEVAHLLMRAGFADALKRYASAFGLPGNARNDHWKLVQAFLEQRDALTAAELATNRALAHGGSKDDEPLKQAAFKTLGVLMGAAGAKGDPRAAVLEHYGVIGSVGLTGGYPSLHVGHVVDDRTETVRQYGHSARIRFAVIDNMWANGFEGWLWDGSAQTGGWSGEDLIVQVRSAYTSGPTSAYALLGDTAERRELLANIAQWSSEDVAKARTGVPTTLRSVNGRLRLQVVEQVAAAAKRHAGADDDFRRAFLDEYWRASNQHSIFIHEGRHAIDKAMASDPSTLDETMLEYHAKLSELALADYPRMALHNINRGIGGSSAHDRAGTRIIGHFHAWIEAHSGQVAGYDPSLPAAVQLDKLTDAQIREVARSLDPLAQGQGSTASAGSPSGTSRR
jgi:hypothetical protein